MTDIEIIEDILHKEKLAEMKKKVYEGDTAPEWHDRVDKIIDEFHLTRKDSVVLLAYIKFFEQRIFEMDKAKEVKKTDDYDGSMFG